MLDAIFKKLFGDKSQKDLKELLPVVDQVNSEFDKIQGISDDELRGKTKKFKQRIQDYIKSISTEIEEMKKKTELDSVSISEKEQIFEEIEEAQNKEDEKIEEEAGEDEEESDQQSETKEE